jgi:hypothetical protein
MVWESQEKRGKRKKPPAAKGTSPFGNPYRFAWGERA